MTLEEIIEAAMRGELSRRRRGARAMDLLETIPWRGATAGREMMILMK